MRDSTHETYVHRFGERIAIDNTDRIMADIQPHVELPEIRRVVFDLENVRECGSHGLKLFLIFRRQTEAMNKELVLLRPSPVLRELLATTGLEQVFQIVESI